MPVLSEHCMLEVHSPKQESKYPWDVGFRVLGARDKGDILG